MLLSFAREFQAIPSAIANHATRIEQERIERESRRIANERTARGMPLSLSAQPLPSAPRRSWHCSGSTEKSPENR